MKTIGIALFLIGAVFLSSCATAVKPLASDAVLRQRIVGSWGEGEGPYGVATFEAGGGYFGVMYESKQDRRIVLTAVGKWWIENGRLYNTISKVEPPRIPIGDEPIVDIIVDISDTVMTLIDDRGETYTKTRVEP